MQNNDDQTLKITESDQRESESFRMIKNYKLPTKMEKNHEEVKGFICFQYR
jgi:hypothetical protein